MKLTLPKLPKDFKLPAWPALRRGPAGAPPARKRVRRLEAAARRAAPAAAEEYDAEEPTTRLSSAFFVVLILHVVAVGGIWAFNSMKEQRRGRELAATLAPGAPAADRAEPASPRAAFEAARPAPAPAVAASQAPAAPRRETSPAPAAPQVAPISGARVVHVKAGDNLTRIASAHGVTVPDLAAANGIKENDPIRVGTTLNLPSKSGRTTTAAPARSAPALVKAATPAKAVAETTYIVKVGDNPTAIARSLKVSQDELLKLNKITDPKKLKPGTKLKVPARKTG